MSKFTGLLTTIFAFILIIGYSNSVSAKKETGDEPTPQMLMSPPMIPINGFSTNGNQHRCFARNVSDQPIDIVWTFFDGLGETVYTYGYTLPPLQESGLQQFNNFQLGCKLEWLGHPGDFMGTFCLWQPNLPYDDYQCLRME